MYQEDPYAGREDGKAFGRGTKVKENTGYERWKE